MGVSLLTRLAVAMATISSCLALPTTIPEQSDEGPTILKPISINDFEKAMGLRRRDSSDATEDFTDLDPQTQSQLIYGSPGENGQLLLANMTLYASDGLPIVMMEKFEGRTKDVDCKGTDGTMSLTFNDKPAFEYAAKTWSKINENEDDRFLMIANHDDCGPPEERQPYIISHVTQDEKHLTTFLASKPVNWDEVASTYKLDFGKAFPTAQARLKARGIGDWLDDVGDTISDTYEDVKDGVEKVGDGIADTVQGNADFSKTVSFPINMLAPNEKHNIWTDPDGRFSLDCVNCYVAGSIQVAGHLSVKGWHLEDLSIDASPQNFNAQLGLQASVTAASKKIPEVLGYQKEIFSLAIPNAGIKVPGLFTLGAKISYNVGFNASISGTAKFDFGLKSTLPDSAKAVLNVAGDTESSATGFQGSVDPYFDVAEISADLKLAVFSKPKISFGVDLTKVGKAEIGLAIKAPELSATLTTKYVPKGDACEDDKNHRNTGVDLELKALVSVDADVDASWGKDADTKLPKWTKSLYSHPWPLPWHPCFGIAIPGLEKEEGAGGDGKGGADTSKPKTPAEETSTAGKKAAATTSSAVSEAAPAKAKPKASSSSTSANTAQTSSPAAGGGGCKFKRENGRRMLVC